MEKVRKSRAVEEVEEFEMVEESETVEEVRKERMRVVGLDALE